MLLAGKYVYRLKREIYAKCAERLWAVPETAGIRRKM